jgi:chromosome partitioning protein
MAGILASRGREGQDAAVSEASDDVAARGRAIFRRLRSGPFDTEDGLDPEAERPGGDDEASSPAMLGEPPVAVAEASVEEITAAETTAGEPATTAPAPPTERAAAAPLSSAPTPVPGPLPGLQDLPDLPEADPEVLEPTEQGATVTAPPPGVEPAEEPPSPFARPLPRVMAVANQKGGVGKTTTAVNLGACLADIGYRVLVVDLDPQGNASTGLGINIRDLQGSMYDVVLHDLPIEDCVEATSVRNLFCAPSSLELAGAEIELVPAFSRELRLRRALEDVRDDYDFVLIDCPPSLGLLTVNAFAAATEVVVPIQCEYYALEGLGQLLRNVNLVQKNLNQGLEVSAIILVMYDARTKLADQVVQEVREHFGDKVCRQVVPRTVRLSEAPSFGQPIIAFDSSSRGAIAYRELAKEVSGGTPQRTR